MDSFQSRIERAKQTLAGNELLGELKNVYSWYISFKKKKKAPHVELISVYEQQLTDLADIPSTWIDYYEYCLNENFTGYERVQLILDRALEQHPTNVHLWVLQIELLELKPTQRIDEHFILELTLRTGSLFSTPTLLSSLLYIYEAMMDYLLRSLNRKMLSFEKATTCIDKMIEVKDQLVPLASVSDSTGTQIAFPFTGENLFKSHDPSLYNLEKQKAWIVQLHDEQENKISIVRDIFEGKILKSKRESKDPQTWLTYISIEKFHSFNNPKIRSLFKRAFSLVGIDNDDREKISYEWVLWEKLFGDDLKSMIDCRKMICSGREKKELKPKRKTSFHDAAQKQKKITHPLNKETESNNNQLEMSQTEEHPTTALANEEDPSLQTENINSANENNLIRINEQEIEIERNLFTLFLSNLLFSIEKQDLYSFFTQSLKISSIKDIRLVYNSNGLFKGYAYLDLTSQNEYSNLLQNDRVLFMNRPMFISKVKENAKKFTKKTIIPDSGQSNLAIFKPSFLASKK